MKNALFSIRSIVAPISFGIGLFLLLTILVNPIHSHAESVGSYSIPYNVAEFTNMNSAMMDNVELAIQYYNTVNNNAPYDSIIVWSTDGIINGYYAYIYTIMVDPYCEENYPSDYDFSLYKVRLKSPKQITNIYISYDSLQHTGTTTIGTVYDILGVPQTINYTNGDCTINYPFYYDGDPILDSDGDEIIISRVSNVVVSGSAVAPNFGAGAGVGGSDFLGSGADFGASISSSTLPSSPTYNTYNFTTYNPPSFDDSSILDALSSIYDILIYSGEYLVTNIAGAIKTLGDNIVILGSYIGDLLKYLVRTIITNIQNGIQNLYENIVSLFEPVLKAFQEVINLGLDQDGNFSLTTLFVNLAIPDPEDLQDAIEDSDSFGLIGVVGSVNTKILSEVNTLKGLSSSKIIHVPSCYFHGVQIGDYDIDFSWYDNYKTFGDGIISAFLIWNYIWFLFFRFPSFIRGQGGAFVSDVNSSVDYSNQFKNS